MAAQRLKEAAEKAKIELSSAMSSQINLPFITADATGPKHLDMTLTRAKFNELTADLVDRTMTPVRKALQDAGLRPSDPVSYTHLDVYKRQGILCAHCAGGDRRHHLHQPCRELSE